MATTFTVHSHSNKRTSGVQDRGIAFQHPSEYEVFVAATGICQVQGVCTCVHGCLVCLCEQISRAPVCLISDIHCLLALLCCN